MPNAPEYNFVPDSSKISLELGDVFNSSANAIVIPRDTRGGISDGFEEVLRNWGLVHPLESTNIGSVVPVRITGSSIKDRRNLSQLTDIIYVTSVDNYSSNYEAIESIGMQLATFTFNNSSVSEIACPLLGTGAGKLDHIMAFEALSKSYASLNPNCILRIYIYDESIFYKLNSYIEEKSTVEINNLNVNNSNQIDVHYPYSTQFESDNKVNTNNFWLLKLTTETWPISNLYRGTEYSFHATYVDKGLNKQREEYKSVLEVKTGDKILGYALGSYRSIVCVFEVTRPVEQNSPLGEKISLTITERISPPIPLQAFREKINFLNELDQNSRIRLIRITSKEYDEILRSESNVTRKISVRTGYEAFFNTEGDHEKTEDKLDFQNDINSFATVISLKDVNPPLAIGLFGNWGAGKSFFMEKLSEKINQNCNPEAKGYEKNENYINNVVQVKFNSWHYSDANLWASIITNIFESLNEYAQKKENGNQIDSIYKNLNITTLQIQETEEKLKLNEKEIEALNKKSSAIDVEIERKKKEIIFLKTGDIVKLIYKEPSINEQIDSLRNEYADENLEGNINEIKQKITELNSFGDRVLHTISIFRKNKKGKWPIVWIILFLFLITLLFLKGPTGHDLITYIVRITASLVSSTMLFWGGIKNFYPYFEKVNKFYKQLKNIEKSIDEEKEKIQLKEIEDKKKIQIDIDSLLSEKKLLQDKLLSKKENKTKLENEIVEIGTGKKLANFIANKLNDDNYTRQLGIISWIRKDFSTLNDLFNQQKKVTSDKIVSVGKPQFEIDRIILYIDDLDRCNVDVVVKVLEAVHLLLAFPLFVVVVGVDPRWLNNALSKKYETLFGNGKSIQTKDYKDLKSEQRFEQAATSYDYLEKIFQIPFSLKPINKAGREQLIEYLLRNEMEPTRQKSVAETIDRTESSLKNQTSTNIPITRFDGKQVDQKEKLADIDEKEQKEVKNIRVTFSEEEKNYMQSISQIFGNTPRSINRYVNIYRIIKSHSSLKITDEFSFDDYMPIMLMLAIVVGYSKYANIFIEQMMNEDSITTLETFLDTLQTRNAANGIDLSENKNDIDRMIKTIKLSSGYEAQAITLENYKMNIELISRFSFRTMHVGSGDID